ncbi:MAG: hypothetical protein R2861_15590 [Desulfobacterales bacterium]
MFEIEALIADATTVPIEVIVSGAPPQETGHSGKQPENDASTDQYRTDRLLGLDCLDSG